MNYLLNMNDIKNVDKLTKAYNYESCMIKSELKIKTSDEFFSLFDTLSNNLERYKFLYKCNHYNFPFYKENQPDAIIQRFYDSDEIDETKIILTDENKELNTIVCVFIKCFGKTIICSYLSKLEHTMMLMSDAIIYDNSDSLQSNKVTKRRVRKLYKLFKFYESSAKIRNWYRKQKFLKKLINVKAGFN